MQSTVAIVKCEDYTPQCVAEAVAESVRLAGLAAVFQAEADVLLKPNLLSARLPEEAVTTHPAVARAVAKIALNARCRVSLGDSPPFAGENEAQYARLCERTGMAALTQELGIPLVRFEEDVVKVANPSGRFYRSFDIARIVSEADLVVNIPKLKTHGLTGFSGAVKNVFGCIPGIAKGLFHVQAADEPASFAQMLIDVLQAVKPDVNIMDAVVGMEGDGPNAGTPKQIGVILASSDPVALDAVACKIVGIEPMSIDTTRLAHEQGLGVGDLHSIEIRGESLNDVMIRDFRKSSGRNDWTKIPSPVRRMLRRQLVASPVIEPRECLGCGDCVEVCPVNAMTPGRPPKIDLSACIRCYCCHEVCNLAAIELRRGWLGNLAFRLMRKE